MTNIIVHLFNFCNLKKHVKLAEFETVYISIYSNKKDIATLRLFVHIVGHIKERKLMADNWMAECQQ